MNRLRQLLFTTVTLAGIATGVAIAQGAQGTAFTSAQDGVDKFVAASRSNDMATLDKILGPDGRDILHSGDAQADKNALSRFVSAYDAGHKLSQAGPDKETLSVGADDWPLPVPLVKGADGWHFDAAAGKDEVLARRIGRNELITIDACKAFIDAQREYASADHGDGILDYAGRFMSSPGKKDGLYWPAKAGEPQSPLGPLFARAQAAGYAPGKGGGPQPFNGYYFRIMDGQGPAAKGGAYSYLAHGKLMGGVALIATPATYGVSGVMTFMVNQDGDVFQKDLGPETSKAAAAIKTFDPGNGWKKA